MTGPGIDPVVGFKLRLRTSNTDFNDYDVTVRVPTTFAVWGTGTLTNAGDIQGQYAAIQVAAGITGSSSMLTEGVHSGDASGLVPSSFRIMRQVLDRLEDSATGCDAGIVRIHGTGKAIAVTSDCTPRYVQADPYEGGKQAVAEAWRNLTAAGALPGCRRGGRWGWR